MDLRGAAVGLRDAIQQKFGVKAKIKTGSPGDFTVKVNGQNVFGYKKEGNLPATDELLRRIAAAQG
jgi:predicted Rdx family selenoprotein